MHYFNKLCKILIAFLLVSTFYLSSDNVHFSNRVSANGEWTLDRLMFTMAQSDQTFSSYRESDTVFVVQVHNYPYGYVEQTRKATVDPNYDYKYEVTTVWDPVMNYWEIYLYKKLKNRKPALSLNTVNNPTLSEVTGYNTLTLSGTYKDADVGDVITAKYTIDGIAAHTNKSFASVTADGTDQPFNYAITINNSIPEGTHTLRVWAEDNKGGKSAEVTINFKVDKTGPTAPTLNLSSAWTNSNRSFTIIGGSDPSGISGYQYRIGTGAWKSGNSGTVTIEGSTTVQARAVDAVGNFGSITSKTANVDKTPPVIAADPEDRTIWNTTQIPISLTFSDSLSGVKSRQYEISTSITPSGNWSAAAQNNVTITINSEGEWYIHVMVVDNANNISQETFGPYRYFTLTNPANVIVSNTTQNSLDIQWTEAPEHEYFVQIKDENGNIVATSEWGAISPHTFTNLNPNIKYTPEVKSRKHGKESAFVAGSAQFTDAKPVTKATFEPMDKAIQVVLDIASTGNPEGTQYIIKNLLLNHVSEPVLEQWIDSGLWNDQSYQYMAKVVNRNGKESEWVYIGTGHTAVTKVEVPEEWKDPVGGMDPIIIPDDFDPDNIEGKVVEFNGELAIVVKGRYINLDVSGVKNAKYYAISLSGYGYSDWKPLDANGGFKESIFINTSGLYKVHLKFKTEFGTESDPFSKNYLVDWISPDIQIKNKVKSQTATRNGTFIVIGSGNDNLSNVLYNFGTGWKWYTPDADIIVNNLTPGYNNIKLKFSDLNGNVIEVNPRIWYLP